MRFSARVRWASAESGQRARGVGRVAARLQRDRQRVLVDRRHAHQARRAGAVLEDPAALVERDAGVDLRPRRLGEPARAVVAALLVGLGEQDDVALERHLGARDPRRGHGERGEAALEVHRAAAVDEAALITPANGSTVQRSRSTPTTSSWPASRSGFSVGFWARRRARKWALPGAGVGTISTSKPSGASRVFSSSAICASLPGGLDVLTRISSCSSATTSPSGPSSCAFDTPGRSAPPIRNVTSTPASRLERMPPPPNVVVVGGRLPAPVGPKRPRIIRPDRSSVVDRVPT